MLAVLVLVALVAFTPALFVGWIVYCLPESWEEDRGFLFGPPPCEDA